MSRYLLALCATFCLMACSTKLGCTVKSSPSDGSSSASDKSQPAEVAKAHPTIRGDLGALVALAETGCEEPFADCTLGLSAVVAHRVLLTMERSGLTFEEAGISPGQLQRLERKANLKIANQKLAALRVRGGAKTPQEIQWISDICWTVYNDDGALPLDGNPVRSELRALAPKDSGDVSGCGLPDKF